MSAESNVVACPACKQPLGGEVVQVQPDPNAAPVSLHETCFLRTAAAAAEQAKLGLISVLSGILHQLGGTVRIHASVLDAGMKRGGGTVNVRPEPDGILVISIGEEKRVVLATPGDVPPRPPLKLA